MTVPKPFSALSARSQVRVLRSVAADTLRHWSLGETRARLVYHGYNTTFRVVDSGGRAFALRLSVNHRKTPGAVLAEMSWLTALSSQTDLTVPAPVRTEQGALTVDTEVPGLDGPVSAALFGWLPGVALDRIAEPRHVVEVGRAMAELHRHARQFRMPRGASLPRIADFWRPDRPFLDLEHPLLDAGRRSVFMAAVVPVREAHAQVDAAGTPMALHADLHLANAKWGRNGLVVLDFDDAVWGVPAHDLAISTYYLRPRQPLVDALFEGYASNGTLPELQPRHLEALLSARNLLLVDELLRTQSADFVEILPRFLENSAIKQRHFLETGAFRHDLPGVVPLW
ncbi:MAG: phosphotransferase [Acidobacteria bacterium]|nr:phosphotransferase [Acidobacteriota bacterium]